jgi:hypothetical protein
MDRSCVDPRDYLSRMLQRVLLGVALIMLMSLTPAYSQISQTFGKISPGAIPSSGLSSEMKRASRYSLSAAGAVSRLCAYLDGNGGVSGSQRYRLALYGDNAGVPGAKVFETREQTISSGTAARWYCVDAPVFPVAAGSYWIAIHTAGTAGVIRDYYDGTAANWYGNADSFNDGAATTFGAGNAGSGTMTLCVEYFPSSEVRAAGRTTVGTAPSAGMSANFKRGSSFTMPERGKLYSVAVYLDGNGTPGQVNVAQAVNYVIYKDANGVPGAKVYDAGGTSVSAGAPASWRPYVPNRNVAPTLDAGKYWIVLHTANQAGIARNFADGTGNWYGNADSAADGASDPFGAGNTGDGTISAYVTYRPGTSTNVLGRTDVGAFPSSGLSANYTRWSHFNVMDNAPTLTGLHAYLDGLGGASGSQKIRMVLYHQVTQQGSTWYVKVAQSDEVTITAGMQPQWVNFPVPTVDINSFPSTYEVAIQTGGTAGVIRDYGDNRPEPLSPMTGNWAAIQDDYADGPIQTIPEPDHLPAPGSVTMSVYATYSIPPP